MSLSLTALDRSAAASTKSAAPPAAADKTARFLAAESPATPCLVVDLDRVEANYRALRAALPQALIYYALKANPAPPILRRLTALGSRFDAASIEEIEACLRAGAAPGAISFGNTIKKAIAIARAHAVGVGLFAFDSDEELEKLAEHAPGARVYCRILVENLGADWPLSRKFGTTPDHARRLLRRAGALGLVPYGLSFHVGSQQTTTSAYAAAIALAAGLFHQLRDDGVALGMLDIGGGFPTRYREAVPSAQAFADAIHAALRTAFGENQPEIIIEPGRGMVGDAGLVRSEVVLVSRRGDDKVRWVYLDIGRFGGLAETEGEAIRYAIATPHDGGPQGPVVIAGPSCDGVDVLYDRANYQLPLALRAGDLVELHAAGAYVATYASQGFNGFSPLAEHYI